MVVWFSSATKSRPSAPAMPTAATKSAATKPKEKAPPKEKVKAAAANATKAAPPAFFPQKGPITLAHAREYFDRWGGYLVWEDNYTEFALWSPDTRDYTEFFGVRFVNAAYRIEKIPRLTRPFIDHGDPVISPMAFTETAARRAEFYRQNPGYKPQPTRWDAATPPLPPRPPSRQPPENPAPATPTPPPAAPTSNQPPLGDPLDAASVIARLQEFSRRNDLPDVTPYAADLDALLRLSGVAAVAPDISGAALDRAIAARARALASVPPSASAFLNGAQIGALEGLLRIDLSRLKGRRDLPPADQSQPTVSSSPERVRPEPPIDQTQPTVSSSQSP